ncbi:cell wall-binding repeat-containing protein [Actinomyces minihominis]|uniref:cell wall-binding repeat-containing protein n=1 Tax=Actinomyces minihominis TaxID=2002838 RepID=UPI000C06EC9F|nr:cell wall-binding repeat-containing protein [Actinomyces minihominis]
MKLKVTHMTLAPLLAVTLGLTGVGGQAAPLPDPMLSTEEGTSQEKPLPDEEEVAGGEGDPAPEDGIEGDLAPEDGIEGDPEEEPGGGEPESGLLEEVEAELPLEEAEGELPGTVARGEFTGATPLARGISRAGGQNRYSTAVNLSQRLFPGTSTAPAVFIASGGSFSDGLTLGALASYMGGPLLLTMTNTVPTSVVNEIKRLQPSVIYVAGGNLVISDSVIQVLKGLAPRVERLAGTNRFQTAEAIAAKFPVGSGAMIATGTDFPDALVASSASAKNGGGGPVLLTNGFVSSPVVEQALSRLMPSAVTIVGGTWSASNLNRITSAAGTSPVLLSGRDRYATSAAVAQHYWSERRTSIIYATGVTFPDAMASVPASKAYDAPILLTQKECRPKTVAAAAASQTYVLVTGGSVAISEGAVTKTCPVLPSVVSQSEGFYRFGMSHRNQINGYYCGPATGEMILSRLGYPRSPSGLALNQQNLAKDAYLMTNRYGRTAWVAQAMSRGLNQWMGKNSYVQHAAPSSTIFRSVVTKSFTTTGRPVVVDTQEWSGGVHYNGHPANSTFSHLMPVEGYNPATDTLIALDPASHFYAASQPSFKYKLGAFTGFLQSFGIYY